MSEEDKEKLKQYEKNTEKINIKLSLKKTNKNRKNT